jgi:hypothetical protein
MTCRWTVSVTRVTCGPRCRRCPGSGLHCSDLSITIRQIASLADRPGGPGVPARQTQNGLLHLGYRAVAAAALPMAQRLLGARSGPGQHLRQRNFQHSAVYSGRSVSCKGRCAADFCRAGDVPRPAVPATKAVQRVVAHTHGPTGTAWHNQADSCLIHSRRTPQSRAAPANYGYRPTGAVPNRAQQPRHDGSSAAVRAGSSAGTVSDGSPGSHTGRVSPRSPRSNPFHGLDGIEDTRARHNAPSPGPSAPWARPRPRVAGHAT